MLDNKEILEKKTQSASCEEENNERPIVFIKIISLKFDGKAKKHYAITKESGKTLAFLETKDFAIYYCMTNNLEYYFLN